MFSRCRVILTLLRGLVSAVLFYDTTPYSQIHAQTIDAVIYPDSIRQVIRGFGGTNTQPARPEMTTGQILNAFGTEPGQVGLSILRLRIPGEISQFARDVPTALAAQFWGVTIIASPWSPPVWMKTNNSVVGGSLYDTSYASYAAFLKSYVDFMSNNNVSLYAVSVQNEPDVQVNYESCSWNASQMLKFAKENAPSVGTRIIAPEVSDFNHAISDTLLNDSTAASHVAIIGGHIYGGGLAPYPLAASKEKELWMTEYLDLDTSWSRVFATGKEMKDCLNAGMSAYIWWYIVRFYGPVLNDGRVSKRGYVMSQFARFIRPGYVRVDATITASSVSICAFKSDSSIIIVAINTSSHPKQSKFSLKNYARAAVTVMPYVTSAIKNCIPESTINIINNNFTATLDDSSITTFVIKIDGGVETISEVARPYTFALSQNYPNPFNPTTVISYQLSANSVVSLKVFDLLGREVATLVNEERSAGSYSVQWNAANIPSGVYFYRLQASDFVQTKKLVLIK